MENRKNNGSKNVFGTNIRVSLRSVQNGYAHSLSNIFPRPERFKEGLYACEPSAEALKEYVTDYLEKNASSVCEEVVELEKGYFRAEVKDCFGNLFDLTVKQKRRQEEPVSMPEKPEGDAPETILVKYHDPGLEKLGTIAQGDWIDLRAAEEVRIDAGEFRLISLGISVKLPKGYEAHIVPRSSTFKNYGILQTNSMGVIDNSYSGNGDVWKFPAYATRDTEIKKNDRICQFRIVKNQPAVTFAETDDLGDGDRGGFGSTGVK